VTPYEDGYQIGEIRREDPTYDVRYDMGEHAKRGTMAEFKRGLNDALDGKDATP
jgi:hypothetical protein